VARATDNEGAQNVSAPANINVFITGERTFIGLQAFYLFQVGEGSTVPDLSDVAPLLNLEIADTDAVNWLPGGGLDLAQATAVQTAGPATKINAACSQSNEVTLEVWIDPATADQFGPARILSISGDPYSRNATLGQGLGESQARTVFDTRLRTTTTDVNGSPSTTTPVGSLTGDLQHVVYTRAINGDVHVYVDGLETVSANIGGTLDTWDPSYPLILGAEASGDRNWLGSLHLVAVYDRAISQFEVQQNYTAGPNGGILPTFDPVVQLDVVQAGQDVMFDETINISATVLASSDPIARVDFLAGGVIVGSDVTAPYQFDWTDPGVGNHLLKAVAVDANELEGNSAEMPVYVSVPANFAAAQMQSDDFFASSLNPLWNVADGTGAANITLLNGVLSTDQPGRTQGAFDSDAQFVFVSQTELDTDVAVEAKLSTSDFIGQAYAGIRLQGAAAEVLQFIGQHDNGSWEIAWGISDGAAFANLGSLVIPDVTDGLWLQVRREGTDWRLLYSTNGLNWAESALLYGDFVLNASGWVSGSNVAGATTTSAFDYFFNLDAPVFPEDQAGGDGTGPVISSVVTVPAFTSAVMTFATDELALVQVDYGHTTQYELGTMAGSYFAMDHLFDFAILETGGVYHYRIRALDIAGNLTVSADGVFATDILGVPSVGPVSGDVYREATNGMTGETWRVTDPDAGAAGAAEFLPNPVLSIDLPDLTHAVRAELIIDRWGGHPGTSGKMVRFNDMSWLHLPEIETIDSTSPECYMYQDNIIVDLPLAQLQAGTNVFEGMADEQVCYSFDWGQWGWYGVLVRIYYDSGAVPQPSGQITTPVADSDLTEMVTIDVSASAPSGIAEVVVMGRYNGVDVDGDGVFNEWHGHYHRGKDETDISLIGNIGNDEVAPFSVAWDMYWVADQDPGSIALQARIRDNDGWWKVTDIVDGLSLERTDEHVKFYTADDLGPRFWARDGDSRSANLEIPVEDDLTAVLEAQLVTRIWNGIDMGVVDINGAWDNTGFGLTHYYSLETMDVGSGVLVNGTNPITYSSDSIHHGIEVLWPGPMVAVRYGTHPAAPVISPPGGVYASSVEVTISDQPNSLIYYTLDGSVPDSGSMLYSGPFQVTNNAMLQTVSYTPDLLVTDVGSASFTVTAASDGRAIDGMQALYLFATEPAVVELFPTLPA